MSIAAARKMSIAAAPFHNNSWDLPIRRAGFSIHMSAEGTPSPFYQQQQQQQEEQDERQIPPQVASGSSVSPSFQPNSFQRDVSFHPSSPSPPSPPSSSLPARSELTSPVNTGRDPTGACQQDLPERGVSWPRLGQRNSSHLSGLADLDQQQQQQQQQQMQSHDNSILQKFSALSVHFGSSLGPTQSSLDAVVPCANVPSPASDLAQQQQQLHQGQGLNTGCELSSSRSSDGQLLVPFSSSSSSSSSGGSSHRGVAGVAGSSSSHPTMALARLVPAQGPVPSRPANVPSAVFSSLDSVDEHSPPFSPAGAPAAAFLCAGRASSFPPSHNRSGSAAAPLCCCLGAGVCPGCTRGVQASGPLRASTSHPGPPRHHSMADALATHSSNRQGEHVKALPFQQHHSAGEPRNELPRTYDVGEMWLHRNQSHPFTGASLSVSSTANAAEAAAGAIGIRGGPVPLATFDWSMTHHLRPSGQAPSGQDPSFKGPGHAVLLESSSPHGSLAEARRTAVLPSAVADSDMEGASVGQWGLGAHSMDSSSLSLSQECSDSLGGGEVSSPMQHPRADSEDISVGVGGDQEAESAFSPGPASCPSSITRGAWGSSPAGPPASSPPTPFSLHAPAVPPTSAAAAFGVPPGSSPPSPPHDAAASSLGSLASVLGSPTLLRAASGSSRAPRSPTPPQGGSPLAGEELRRGLSSYFGGKSRSFTSLAEVTSIQSIQELAKPVRSYNRRKRLSAGASPRGPEGGRCRPPLGVGREGARQSLFKKGSGTRQSLGVQASLAVAYAMGSLSAGAAGAASAAAEEKPVMETVMEESAEAVQLDADQHLDM